LLIELDGGQHALQIEADKKRAEWLAGRGFRVLRFWNSEVVEDAVIERIAEYLRSPHRQL